jgi:hypothetical protein
MHSRMLEPSAAANAQAPSCLHPPQDPQKKCLTVLSLRNLRISRGYDDFGRKEPETMSTRTSAPTARGQWAILPGHAAQVSGSPPGRIGRARKLHSCEDFLLSIIETPNRDHSNPGWATALLRLRPERANSPRKGMLKCANEAIMLLKTQDRRWVRFQNEPILGANGPKSGLRS